MIRLFAFTILMITTLAHTALAAPEIGQPAPAFTGTDAHGNVINLSDYNGQIVVLEWTNHECPYVRKHYDTKNMQNLQKDATDKGIIWLTINSSATGKQGQTGPEEALALIQSEESHETARILDPEGTIGRLYDARTTPHMFVINQEGVLVYMGAIDDAPGVQHDTVTHAKNYVREALSSLVLAQDITTSSTQPYGCSVKY